MVRDWPTLIGAGRPSGRAGTPIWYPLGNQAADLRQGELVRYAAGPPAGVVRMVRDAPGFAGLVAESQVSTMWGLGNQPRATPPEQVRVWSTGIHELVAASGETFTHGVLVYMAGLDTQRVTVTAGVGGLPVGRVHLPNQPARVGDTAGTVRVPIMIDDFAKAT
jgi:hypothetical protein